jgi:hypothetical protein
MEEDFGFRMTKIVHDYKNCNSLLMDLIFLMAQKLYFKWTNKKERR